MNMTWFRGTLVWKDLCFLVFGIAAAFGVGAETLSGSRAEWCEQQWLGESRRFVSEQRGSPDLLGLVDQWRAYRSKCGGSVAYEARLAVLLAMTGRSSEARVQLAPVLGPGAKSSYANLVELAQLQIETWEILADSEARQRERLLEVEKKHRNLVRRYPDWPIGLAVLGGLQTNLGLHSEAVSNLNRAKSADSDMFGIYRNLTISLAALGRYRDALDAADIAVEMNQALFSDPEFVCAGAIANAGLGQFKSARLTLQVLVSKQPNLRHDSNFALAVSTVKTLEENARQGERR